MLKTAKIFQDGMILQRDKQAAVWGTNTPGAEVSVEIQGKEGSTVTDPEGTWKVMMPELEASEEETLVIRSGEETLTYTNVAVGEVWVAGGQSNMEFWMRYEKHKAEAVQDCPDRRIRFYDVPEVCYDGQLEAFDYSRQAVWREAVTQEELEYFSAVGYYFQKEIEKALDVPVGIIGCNWGGTCACAWMNPETVSEVGKPWIEYYNEIMSDMDMDKFWKTQNNNPLNDRGNLFTDPFGEFVLPRTPSREELMEFFGALEEGFEDYFNTLMPQQIPGCLYEHMVKTIAPYSIRGFLWYQGESDDDVPGKNVLYKDMLTGLISDWRKLWGEDTLPFLLVQLPGFKQWLLDEKQNQYPIIRKCQEMVADTVEGAYMCSIADAGEEFDIHPKNKKVVGERLALLARGHVYGEDILCEAPRAKEMKQDGARLIIDFDHAKGGLKIDGEKISALKIFAGEREVEFEAHVEGSQLVVDLKDCEEEKVSVEFAQTSWYLVNLYNQAGVPAVPFRF